LPCRLAARRHSAWLEHSGTIVEYANAETKNVRGAESNPRQWINPPLFEFSSRSPNERDSVQRGEADSIAKVSLRLDEYCPSRVNN